MRLQPLPSWIFALVSGAASAWSQVPAHKVVNTYYAQWTVYNGFTVKQLDSSGTARHLDLLSYAFVNLGTNANGQYECTSFDSWADNGIATGATPNTSVGGQGLPSNGLTGNFGQLLLLKQRYPNLKIIITIGGASVPPEAFSQAAATDASRKHFVASCITDYIQGHFAGAFGQAPNAWESGVSVQGPPPGVIVPDTPGLFDGIEVDWEYPTADDTQNFTALLNEFRAQLDAVSARKYLLSFDAPAASWAFTAIDLPAVARSVNYIDLMTYDYAGPWQSETGFVAPLYQTKYDPNSTLNVDYTVNAYLSAGVPPGKILLGIPFYGYGWTVQGNSGNTQEGQFENATPLPNPGSGPNPVSTESYSYIKTTLVPNYEFFSDLTENRGSTVTPWLFNGSIFWTYENADSILQKMQYAQSKGLGGAFSWEASGDLPDGQLAKAIYAGLNGLPIY